MINRVEIALQKFRNGYNCAQAVFYSFSAALNIEEDLALKLATGFGAGMGGKQEVCGAISGGVLVIGAKYGRGEKDNRRATGISYQKTMDLMNKFEEKHGTGSCRQLLDGCALTTRKGQMSFKANNLKEKTCVACVQNVVEILEEIL